MVSPIQNVQEAEFHKLQGRLMPTRIEPNQSGIAGEFESADWSVRRHEAEHRDRPDSQPGERCLYRKFRMIGLNRTIEKDVELALVPVESRVAGRLRVLQMSQKLLIRSDRSIRLN